MNYHLTFTAFKASLKNVLLPRNFQIQTPEDRHKHVGRATITS